MRASNIGIDNWPVYKVTCSKDQRRDDVIRKFKDLYRLLTLKGKISKPQHLHREYGLYQ